MSEDTISRQAAIDAICKHGTELERRGITVLSVANHKQATVDLLESLPSARTDLDEFCFTCKEYDQEKHCCPRWNRVIRKTAEEVRQNAQPEQRWIPVTERLPIEEFEEGRKNGTVYDLYPCLVTRYSTHTDEPRTRTYVCKSYFDGEDFMLHGGYAPNEESDTENTLAWMPLPEVYREETEDEL